MATDWNNVILNQVDLYFALDQAVRHVRTEPEMEHVTDLDNRVKAAEATMADIGNKVMYKYLDGYMHGGTPCHIMTQLKAVTHHYLRMSEPDPAPADETITAMFDKTLLKNLASYKEAKALREGYGEMFSDIVEQNKEICDMIERARNAELTARRRLEITLIQAAEAACKTDVMRQVYNGLL